MDDTAHIVKKHSQLKIFVKMDSIQDSLHLQAHTDRTYNWAPNRLTSATASRGPVLI